MKKAYYIGCSGYYYPAWRNNFYPEGLQPRHWLEYYSSQFNTVELNGTFYRTPKLSDLENYHNVTPPDFRFAAKMNKLITHTHQLRNMLPEVMQFQDLLRNGLKDKLNHFLFQLPPSFHYSEKNLGYLLQNIPHASENVVELRHISWWNETVKDAFTSAGLTFCNVDFPGLQSYFIHTSPHFYLRLHGSPDLFKSAYTEAQLAGFSVLLPPDSQQNSIYFNNTYYEAGYTNARQLNTIIASKHAHHGNEID